MDKALEQFLIDSQNTADVEYLLGHERWSAIIERPGMKVIWTLWIYGGMYRYSWIDGVPIAADKYFSYESSEKL